MRTAETAQQRFRAVKESGRAEARRLFSPARS